MAMNRRTPRQEASYAVAHVVTHLVSAGQHDRLFDLIEAQDFLARQATTLGGFRQSSQDLETQVLPLVIEQRDWPRFLRHAVVAMGLRGLAEALADEEVVGALVEHGQHALASDIAEQLTDPQWRIRARAVVLSSRRRGVGDRPAADQEKAQIIKELDAVPPPNNEQEAQAWLETLQTVARHLGHLLDGHWHRWIGRLGDVAPELADDAWLAVARNALRYDLGPESGLWPALEKVASSRVLSFLPRRLAASPGRAMTFLDHPLPPPFDGEEELWSHVKVALSAAEGSDDPWSRLRSIPIRSIEIVELGRGLWPRLSPEQRDDLAAELTDPTIHAAFRIVVLEGLRSMDGEGNFPSDETAAFETLDKLPREAQLHWTLCYLSASAPSRRRRQHIRTVAHHLYTVRYDIAVGEDLGYLNDLARFVDLVAEELPTDLPRVLPSLAAAPASTAETLRALAAFCQREEVLEQLRDHAERFAAAVGKSDGEGFQLRAEVLSRVAGRLCARHADLTPYRDALERLLPEEEDALRLAVIDELATGDEACRRLALEVSEELRSRRLALRTRLRLSAAGEKLDDVLTPAALFKAVSGSDAVTDELAALGPLLELPTATGERSGPQGREGLFLDVQDSDRRILALLDLTLHDLAFQRRAFRGDQLDPVAALQPLSRIVGGVTNDQRLVALIPELVEIGSRVSPNRAVAELQEAVLRLLRLDNVAWSLRAEALETLLRNVEKSALAGSDQDAAERGRAVVTFFRWIVRLPSQPELPAGLRDRWPELLPIVLAAEKRLSQGLKIALRRHPLSPMDRWLPAVGPVRMLTSPWIRGPQAFEAWAVGEPEVLKVCFASAEEISHHLQETMNPEQPSATAQALFCLLATEDGARALELVQCLARPAREAMELRLVRHGWLDDDVAAKWIEDSENAPRLYLARELRRESDSRNVDGVAPGVSAALAGGELDPLDARFSPWRRALWALEGDSSCTPMARAAVNALTGGGRNGGERALCFWVHGWVKPRPGQEAPESRDRRLDLMAALRQAETIPKLGPRPLTRETA